MNIAMFICVNIINVISVLIRDQNAIAADIGKSQKNNTLVLFFDAIKAVKIWFWRYLKDKKSNSCQIFEIFHKIFISF